MLVLRRATTRLWRPASWAQAAYSTGAAETPAAATPHLTSSSSQLWESAVQSFYATYERYTHHCTDALTMTHEAELSMRRCLAERRAVEALDIYQTVCQCGLVGVVAAPVLAFRDAPHTATHTLDQLAQQALQHVPHRQRQYSMLSLLMAAEDDALSTRTAFCTSAAELPHLVASPSPPTPASSGASLHLPTLPDPLSSSATDTLSAAEAARIRVQQRLYALHATRQLSQSLGKEYCLVEMHHLCAAPLLTGVLCPRAQAAAAATLHREIELDPLCRLSRTVLEHPFAYRQPSAAWAQRELLWEADMHGCGSSGSFTATTALTPADAARLLPIEEAVRPYRQLCTGVADFLATWAPSWDALVVRRVAETLVLPPEVHAVFPEGYRRARQRTQRRRQHAHEDLFDPVGASSCQGNVAASAWVDSASHRLFCTDEELHGIPHASFASPIRRVEAIVKRRVHHDVVVPDAVYVMQRFHQLQQLARHREVVITHAVFLDLVAAASLSSHPVRFHVRHILREMMRATTTALTGQSHCEQPATPRHHNSNAGGDGASIPLRKHPLAKGGFTLLGLQDELALLERCPERFFLAETLLPFTSGEAASAPLDRSAPHAPPASSLSCFSWSSSVSVVLVGKQLERMIAAHDRGDSFEPDVSNVGPGQLSSSSSSIVHAPVDDLVRHLLDDRASASADHRATSSTPAGKQAGLLFRNRSRGLWARLPTVVATTQDCTRAAAFTIGLSMYPPASVAP